MPRDFEAGSGGGGVSGNASSVTVTPVTNVDSANVQAAIAELDGQKQQRFRTVANQAEMCSAFLDDKGNLDYPTIGAQVYRSDLARMMYLAAGDYTNPANWGKIKASGTELVVRASAGAFDAALINTIQHINIINDTLDTSTMIEGAEYKLIADIDMLLTVVGGQFSDYPSGCADPTHISLNAGDSIVVMLLEDGVTIDLKI